MNDPFNFEEILGSITKEDIDRLFEESLDEKDCDPVVILETGPWEVRR